MARVLSTAFCVALLAATAGAFALTQGAKVELAPVYQTHVDKVFSPVCSCRTRTAQIAFRLRRSDRLTVWVERDGRQVRTLVTGRSSRPGTVALVFDGRDDAGAPLPDGAYRPVIRLEREHRTIELPNTMLPLPATEVPASSIVPLFSAIPPAKVLAAPSTTRPPPVICRPLTVAGGASDVSPDPN